ncbi:MAG: ABC transporter substrate-binding protein [Burkholderiales bacterium]
MTARRRVLQAMAGVLLGAGGAGAQAPRRVPVIGFLTTGGIDSLAQFREAMRDLGYAEGRDMRIERRSTEGRAGGLDLLAAELVRLQPDVIYATGPAAVRAARAATSTIPIVVLDLETDPVAAGLVASLARPGGNLTGLFLDQPALAGKWLELAAEVLPGRKRVALLNERAAGKAQLSAAQAAGQRLGFTLQVIDFDHVEAMFAGLDSAAANGAQAVVMLTSPMISNNSKRLAEWAVARRMPGISPFRAFADAGGLMSYGPDLLAFRRFSATYVDRILKGARPGDLPIQQPARFLFVVNQRAAQALGIALPAPLLLRADEVIA